MKKTLIGPLVTVIVLALLGAMFIYFHISMNRMEKTLIDTQTAIADNSGKIQSVVNFFNANAGANAESN